MEQIHNVGSKEKKKKLKAQSNEKKNMRNRMSQE